MKVVAVSRGGSGDLVVTYSVLIRCPHVDKAVPTGTVCDLKSFEALSAKTLFNCPECGQTHRWSVHDAWLRDEQAFEQVVNQPELLASFDSQ